MPTIYEIGKTINRSSAKNSPTIVHGMRPAALPAEPGKYWLKPAQLLSIEIPRLARNNGHFVGFQRSENATRARKIGRAMTEGVAFPAIDLALLPDGRLVCSDGQHRALGGVIAGVDVLALVEERTEDQARILFANQGKGSAVNGNILVLAGTDPFAEYVQDACTSSDHPWADVVGEKSTESRIGAKQMYDAICNYAADRLGQNKDVPDTFSRSLCDELAGLVRAFGTKRTNEFAFRQTSVRAITDAAILVIRRGGSSRADIDRWCRHMPQFPFADYQHLRKSTELTDALLDHWNKRLSPDRRVKR